MEKENTNSGSVYVTVDGHLNPVHVSMKGTGEEGFLVFMLEDVEKALKEAGIAPEKIEYINAHGTSTHHNDLFETMAVKKALGDHAYKVTINSTKSMFGHLLGAAGGVEFIACVKSIEDGFVHATAGLKEAGEGCDLDYTMGEGVPMDIHYALTNSLGFGGVNASLVIKKFED